MENEKKTGYILYDFMMKEMGLDGVALKVYALIYSFTKAGSDCRGSVRYIGERTDSAKSSVHRALNELLEKGYIIKLDNYDGKTSRYIANMNRLSQGGGTVSVPETDVDVPKSDTIIKIIIKTIILIQTYIHSLRSTTRTSLDLFSR